VTTEQKAEAVTLNAVGRDTQKLNIQTTLAVTAAAAAADVSLACNARASQSENQ